MRRFGISLGVMAFLLVPSSSALAWNEFGHMAAAKIAYKNLDEAQQAKIAKILQAHPHYEEYLAKNCPEGVSVNEWAFLRASIWPDWIRPRKNDPRGVRVTKYHRSPDHYVTVPFIHPANAEMFKDIKVDSDVQDVMGAYRQRFSELKAPLVSDEDKAIAICWMLHLIGDVHQPLHCGSLFSNDYKTGDLGGNKFTLKIGDTTTRLHTYWDNALGAVPGNDDAGVERQTKLYKQLTETVELLQGPDYKPSMFPEFAENTSFSSWVRESNELAIKVVYLNGKLKGVPTEFDGTIPQDAPKADDDYEPTAKALAKKRVVLAGYRLAEKLKLALAKE